MDWLQSLVSGDNGTATQMIAITLALVVVLILIVWLFRRIASAPAKRASSGLGPRLSVTDVAAIDDKRFLVLIRRDDVEHLVMIGGPTDVVVESGIGGRQTSPEDQAPAYAEKRDEPVSTAPSLSETKQSASVTPAVVAAATAAVATSVANEVVETEAQTEEIEQVPEIDEVEVVQAIETAAEEPVVAAEQVPPEEPVVQEEEVVAMPEVDQVEAPVTDIDPEAEESLQAAISENLEDALSIDELDVADEITADQQQIEPQASDEIVVEIADPDAATDDEMRQLLDELAGEKKEPA